MVWHYALNYGFHTLPNMLKKPLREARGFIDVYKFVYLWPLGGSHRGNFISFRLYILFCQANLKTKTVIRFQCTFYVLHSKYLSACFNVLLLPDYSSSGCRDLTVLISHFRLPTLHTCFNVLLLPDYSSSGCRQFGLPTSQVADSSDCRYLKLPISEIADRLPRFHSSYLTFQVTYVPHLF